VLLLLLQEFFARVYPASVPCEGIFALQLASLHNLSFYLWLVKEARRHILNSDFSRWKKEFLFRLQSDIVRT